jgi:hypothetical protein
MSIIKGKGKDKKGNKNSSSGHLNDDDTSRVTDSDKSLKSDKSDKSVIKILSVNCALHITRLMVANMVINVDSYMKIQYKMMISRSLKISW